jgi:hypothetical protein
MKLTRRHFVAATLSAIAAGAEYHKKKVAAIVTEYRPLSHADVIVGRFLDGYSPNDIYVRPKTHVVSMYTDQISKRDMSRDLAAKHGFPIYPTIEQALTLGGDKLAVDAVLFVGEHGDYPWNERGQHLYPRHKLLKEIVDVYRKNARSVPTFSDKHLSYDWNQAKEMYGWSKELNFPFMAGSSIPVTVRTPELEIPYGAGIKEGVVIGYGNLDAYGFHTLESMQCMVERRRGGETGVASVEWIEGDEVWKYRDGEAGAWSRPLLEQALARNPRTQPGRPEDNVKEPSLFLVNYKDGLRTAAYMLNGHARGWSLALRLNDRPDPVSTFFGFTSGGRRLIHFDGLVYGIEHLFTTGKPLYPVERTLLTTGTLSFLFESRVQKKRLETPELNIEYKAPENTFFQRA